MKDRVLDIAEHQVAVRYPDHPNFEWHLRVLVVRLDGARWIVPSPDLEVFVLDLAVYRVIPLVRGALVPQRIRGNFYGLANLGEEELADLRRECGALATVYAPLSAAPATTSSAEWRFSDPAITRFGELVDPAVTANPARVTSRGRRSRWSTWRTTGGSSGRPRKGCRRSTWTTGRRRSGPVRDETLAFSLLAETPGATSSARSGTA